MSGLLKGMLIGVLIGLAWNVAWAGARIAARIEQGNTFYLCIEAAKLRIENPKCNKIIRGVS